MATRPSSQSAQAEILRRWATTRETAAYLHIGERTVRRMVADGHIVAHRIGRRLVRIDLNEVDEAFRVLPSAGTATSSRGGK